MATISAQAQRHYIMVSGTRQITDDAQTRNVAFRMTDNASLSPSTPVWHRLDSESGRRSWASEGAMVPGRMEWSKQYRDVADDSNLALFGVFAASGETAGGVARIGVTSVYIQDVMGPASGASTTSNIKAFTLEDVGLPGIQDDAYNRLVYNVFPESVTVSGRAGGFVNISAQLRGGGKDTAIGGAATTPVYFRNRVFRFSDMALLSNLTCGMSAINVTGFTSAPSSAQFLSDTQLTVAGAVDLTSICKSFTMTINNTVNVDDSYQPGYVDANGFAVVPALGWVRTGHSVRIEAKFLLGDTNSKLLRAESRAGTQRGIELWLKHPMAVETGAYVGNRISFGYADLVAYSETPDGLGPKYINCTWEAVDSGTEGTKAWRYIAANTYTTAITA